MRLTASIARRALRDSRARNLWFAFFFALVAYLPPSTYASDFPTMAERVSFAESFGENNAVRFFYGAPNDLLTAGGYAAWRFGGFMSIVAATWGLLAAVRAMRTEEDAGRQEVVLAGAVSRRSAFGAAVAAIGAGAALLWAATVAGLLAAGLSAGGSAYLALAVVTPAFVFGGVGALASQLASTRRVALEIGGAALLVALLARVAADTASGLGWLRWASPLGWYEELRAFADPEPAVLLLPLAGAMALLAAARRISLRRDIGSGLLEAHDRKARRLGLISSATAQALRAERRSLAGWAAGIGLFAAAMGMVASTFSTATISENLQQQLEQVSGGASLTTATGALSYYFLFFVLALGLFACAQIAAARHEESDQRLETLFALPVSRRCWLGGRLLLGAAGAAGLALVAGLFAWAGAAAQGADVALSDMLAAAANCLPATLLFLGLGALAFAAVPRASVGIAYGFVSVGFAWELFGSLLEAPDWLLSLSPFHAIGLVPAQPFEAIAAAVMLAIAAIAAIASVRLFERRDLVVA